MRRSDDPVEIDLGEHGRVFPCHAICPRKREGLVEPLSPDPARLVADADPQQRGASGINRAPGPDRPETAAEIRQPPGRDQRVLAAVRNPRHRAMPRVRNARSEEHTSELQSLMRHSYAVICLKKKKPYKNTSTYSR